MAREKNVWLTIPEMAEYMCVGRKYAYRLINSGAIPSYKLSERKTVVKRSEVDDYISRYQQ